jgi:hypothetical protein
MSEELDELEYWEEYEQYEEYLEDEYHRECIIEKCRLVGVALEELESFLSKSHFLWTPSDVSKLEGCYLEQ